MRGRRNKAGVLHTIFSLVHQLIDTPKALENAIAQLSVASSIAFDLEFDSNMRRYGVTLGLIQIAVPGKCFLIDPLAGLDLNPVWDVLQNPRILKGVHSPGEDLRLLHSLGCFPSSLWDTEISARLLNYERTSVSAMLEEKLGVVLSGGQQRSNWLARPLTAAQQVYAAADALHLFDLKAVLDAELQEKDLWDFAQDEQAFLSAQRFLRPERDSFLKSADEHHFSPWQQHVLNALLATRDAIAQQRARPTFHIADEKIFRELVQNGGDAETILPDSISPAFRNEQAVNKLLRAYQKAVEEATAQNLSTAKPRRKHFPTAEREQSKRSFETVQTALAARYGIFAARFLLSNAAVSDLLDGKKTLRTLGSAYRQQVILDLAAETGIDLRLYQ